MKKNNFSTPVVTETTATSVTITWDSGNPDPVTYYIIQYRAKSPDSKYETVDDITTTRYSIGGLYPNTEYEIRVSAVNTIGQGPPSEPVETRTGEQAPASPPRNIQAQIISQNTMMVRWEEPEEPNGQIKGYRVYYTMDDNQPMSLWQIHNVQDSIITTIQSLVPQETYTIKVLAFTSVGDGPFSEPIHVKVLQGVPGQPSKFQVGAVSDTSIELTWEAAYEKEGIINYELRYMEGSFGTQYHFSLAAISNKGIGAFTNDISQKTLQAKPSAPPQDIKCSSTSSTTLLVSWRPPPLKSQNGVLAGYNVRYQVVGSSEGGSDDGEPMEEPTVPATAEQVLLQRLEKWTQYRVTVSASTVIGPGPESAPLICRTDEDVPGAPPRRVEVEVLNSTALKVMWRSLTPGKQHGQIRGYQVHYVRVENGESRGLPLIKDVMLADAQEMVIGGLKPDTTYSITVAAYTTKGDGARSKPKLVVTKGAVPGLPYLSVAQDSETSAMIRWDPPDLTNGMDLQGYRLQFGRKDVSPLATLEFSPQERQYSVGNIHRGATYLFKVSAKSRGGFGEEAVVELGVPENTPGGYPQIDEGSNVTCCSVQLSWSPPVLAERNGKITEYTLAYKETSTGGAPKELRLPPSQSSYVLNSLKPNSAYDVKIRAHTIVGPGPYSPPIQYRTVAFDSTDVPKNFTVKWATKTTVVIAWTFSESRSPYKCTIEYNRQKMDVDARQMRVLVTGLKHNTTYEFRVTCQESMDGGPRHRVVARTAPLILVKKPKLDIYAEPDNMPTMSFPPVDTKDVKTFYVVVVPLKRTSGAVKNLKNPDEMDMEELLREVTPKRRSRRQLAQLDQRKPYITACFRQLPSTFMVGSDYRHSSCENKPLEPGQEYVFFLLAELNATAGKMFATSPYTDTVITPKLVVEPLETGDGLIWVVGPVLAVVFIICIVIAILLYKNRKRKESEPRTKCLLNNADITPHHPTDPVEMRRINFQTPDSGLSSPQSDADFDYESMMNHPPIPISELAEHTELLKANDNLKLSQEYETPMNLAKMFFLPKCRYSPYAQLNACVFGERHTGSQGALACQAQLYGALTDWFLARRDVREEGKGERDELADMSYKACCLTRSCDKELSFFFKRVIMDHKEVDEGEISIDPGQQFTWEHSNLEVNKPKNRYANVIAYDHSRIKCDQYWPSRGTETYGMTQVTLLDTIELATFCVRTFSLHKNGSSEKREVRQFQFTAWPDHGVPEYPTPFLAFLRRVKTCNPPDAGPIIAHCSAGVGRTGCFIVIDAMLERIKHEKTVDIYGHVTLMRSQRNYMVQTEDQYSFIHDALLEAVACGNTEVAARSLYSYIQKLAQVESGEHVTGMELEFKRLANSKAHTSRFISANLPCNKFKNRLVNIMPYETTRVCLQPIRGLEGSDYINSSFIDGYRYQYFVVDPMAEYNMPQYILREFKVTDARDGQSRTVRQFQFTDWPEQGVPKSGEGFIDFIGQVHKTKEQFGQDGPISVHCSAGVGRTGVFITLSIVLERMRYEGVVDIFQTVKMLRTQRPAMVQTEDEYQFCYHAALEYLGSFDHYAT
ncbi:hypothetical protein FQN60_012837 [Etheostoma spectabile]|uniref:Uncharacterized protein n=1 Tax=Etheostoma spectabile TaxID=54343 RepID=A0A5J5D442_9PERO|nr:hypothetical protein FQN60_012837 [Etheostoma spectabile]